MSTREEREQLEKEALRVCEPLIFFELLDFLDEATDQDIKDAIRYSKQVNKLNIVKALQDSSRYLETYAMIKDPSNGNSYILAEERRDIDIEYYDVVVKSSNIIGTEYCEIEYVPPTLIGEVEAMLFEIYNLDRI